MLELRSLTKKFGKLTAVDQLDISIEQGQVYGILGPNGSGKTSVLEAIHLLAALKPLRGRHVSQLIAWGHSDGAVAGWVEHAGIERAGLLVEGAGRALGVFGVPDALFPIVVVVILISGGLVSHGREFHGIGDRLR